MILHPGMKNLGIGTIFLAWRKGKSSRRKIVGVIKKNATSGVRFSYIKAGVEEAQKEGFTPYVDFPDTEKVYSDNVLEIFGQRLIKTERSDIQKYLDFWDISPEFKIEPGTLKSGDILSWKLEKDNPKDDSAVKVLKGTQVLGYVKMIHSRVFHSKTKPELKIRVKSIDQNGTINRVFIEISL